MANTSCSDLSRQLLDSCLHNEAASKPLLNAIAESGCWADFFRIVVEGLADRFEPGLAMPYARMMAAMLGHSDLSFDEESLIERYRRVSRVRRYEGPVPARVVVLSRVTLGADVAVTSRILDAVKQRYPDAEVLLAGSRKAWELFAGDERVGLLEVSYPRGGSLEERLAPWRRLRELIPRDALVIDPDSRLTQLGLLPVCEEERYLFFDSRSFGGEEDDTLGDLTARWCGEVLGVQGRAYLQPAPSDQSRDRRRSGRRCTVSLGVGENLAKRVPGVFEAGLLRELLGRGFLVTVDKGAGGEEAERVERAAAAAGYRDRITIFEGAFAPFAAAIMSSDLYTGYDSAGQHVAAAAEVPLVSVFAGFPCERMHQRWRPSGKGRIEIVRVDDAEAEDVLARTRRALDALAL